MEHTRIAPPNVSAFSPDVLETLAQQGLRELLHAPIPKVARVLAQFDREQLNTAIEVMIAMLDAADGDPDAETGVDLEDDFELTDACRTRAQDACADTVDQDAGAYVEWTSLPRRRMGEPSITLGHEDDEETDHSGQCDEDGVNTGNTRLYLREPGCPISDPGGGDVEDEGECVEGLEL